MVRALPWLPDASLDALLEMYNSLHKGVKVWPQTLNKEHTAQLTFSAVWDAFGKVWKSIATATSATGRTKKCKVAAGILAAWAFGALCSGQSLTDTVCSLLRSGREGREANASRARHQGPESPSWADGW